MNIVALIQARMGSTRLPGKALLPLHGLPLIDWVVRRTQKAALLNRVITTVPDTPHDDELVRRLQAGGCEVFRGPEQDVLRRFYLAAKGAKATHVVRVCADNPLIWGGEIDALIREYPALPEQDIAYAYNHIPRNNRYPDGLGAEMVSFALLERLERQAVLPEHREHCLSFIWDNAAQFHIHTFDPADPRLHRPDIRLDVDTPDDFAALARLPLHPDMPPEDIVRVFDRGSS